MSAIILPCQNKGDTTDGVSSSDKRKIEAAVYDYFDGQGEADFARLDRAFNENAAMFGVREDDNGPSG